MSRLHIPGVPFVEDRASRFKRTGAVFRPISRRVAFRENLESHEHPQNFVAQFFSWKDRQSKFQIIEEDIWEGISSK
ncbi:hypothetical protein VTN00DRAFT_5253 [Thermoascus crustaceus]|uniref:uncharacterized protein n=1 Tax=Thermoascus crustaceus TaxID=5088 RepID=UPI003743F0B1